MDASDIMTRFVVTVPPTATLGDIAKTLASHAISGVPVCREDGVLAGIVTEGDLVRPLMHSNEKRRDWWLRHLADGTDLAPAFLDYAQGTRRTAAELMRADVVTAAPAASVGEIAELMMKHDIKRVPIVQDGKLVGIVTRADLVKALARDPAALMRAEI